MTHSWLPTRPCAIGITLALTLALVTGCGDDGALPGANSTDSVQGLLDDWAGQGRGGVAVAMAGNDDELTLAAAGTTGPDGGVLDPNDAFRVGSLTKTFVAVMVLQLVADGTLGLDDLVVDHAPELTIADGVTIRQLLAHRSGIPEHTDSELAPAVLADPARAWTPADVLELVADQSRDFSPGELFAYSNTNYVIAGLLLEAVTGVSLADNLSARIVEPLALTSTWIAPAGGRTPIGGFSPSLPGGDTNATSYVGLETAAGAAGALVSTASDLATFLRALAHGELLPASTYAQMTRDLPSEGWSLGVFAADPPSAAGISNAGAIPGFTAYMQYDPATEDLVVLLLNDDSRSPESLGAALSAIGGAR